MNSTSPAPSILVVDDKLNLLNSLKNEIVKALSSDDVQVRSWRPTAQDSNSPFEEFKNHVGPETVLVVTDNDLTSEGMKGLFGHTLVAWCQQLSIPVGDFSRGNKAKLPTRPSLFELRIPSNNTEGARFIASAFTGFKEIKNKVFEQSDTLESGASSPASVLARLLDRPHLDSHFSLYMSRLGTGNSALVDQLLKRYETDNGGSVIDKRQMLSYVLGHVLLNSILKFPGPILSDVGLCAYLATSREEFGNIRQLFLDATYTGPFGDYENFFWQEDVDAIIEKISAGMESKEFSSYGEYNRAMVERELERELIPHDCDHCDGRQGGFLCPFTERTVCQRADCSASSSSWIPQGAQLSRVQRDFFNEWAPVLGL